LCLWFLWFVCLLFVDCFLFFVFTACAILAHPSPFLPPGPYPHLLCI
jgi:hypothetical protein